MSLIKGCIFDLDGVIVDTAKYHYLAWKRLSDELGFEFSQKDNERLKGVSRMACMEILIEIGGLSLSEAEKHSYADKKNGWYVEYISDIGEEEVLPGARDFITRLKAAGIKIALGSASKNAGIILKSLKLTEYFDAIIDGNKVSKAKPDPEVFLLGAQELGLPPENCVVFEDAKAGVEAARRAGMKCIGIGTSPELSDADIMIPGFENVDLNILNL
ncbi:MAG TPA: beta-phosphoglucomutase [Clostridia bacterium]|nr:beta-phosphoglucomutase [Clostridia bacterium]